MKIKEIKVKNILGIKYVVFSPNENATVIQVGGNNGQGKSSLIDSIWVALKGKVHFKEVCRKGTVDDCEVELLLDNGLLVNRKFKDGVNSLHVYKDGVTQTAPQKFLDEIINDISLDPYLFLEMENQKQIDTVCTMAGINIKEYQSVLNNLVAERTIAGRQKRTAEDVVTEYGSLQEPLPAESAQNLMNEYTILQEKKSSYDRNLMKVASLEKDIEALEIQIAQKRIDLADAKAAISPENNIEQSKFDEIKQKISDINKKNEESIRYKEYQKAIIDRDDKIKNWQQLDNTIAEMRKDLVDKVSKINIIDGMTIDFESGVLVHGVPISQLSSSEKIRFSTNLAIKLSPNLKILRVHNGNDLDENNKKLLIDIAEKNGYQLWLEYVGNMGDIVIEEGEAK